MVYAQDIGEYRWKNRVLLLVDKTAASKSLQSQLKVFSDESLELEERALLVFIVTPEEIRFYNGQISKLLPAEVYRSISISENFSGVILIGKDGGVKLKKPFEVTADDIFTLIDGMPMRKSEINKKKENRPD